LEEAETEGKAILQAQHALKINGTLKNERKVTDFDDSDIIDRVYFLEIHFPNDKLDTSIPLIDDAEQEKLIKVLIKFFSKSLH
jgi:hypothetical protein